ncbi:MAG TPA: 16S rRNA (guanine(966)-N(2))-methyltransferase RsmD [Steroidobacteraceae bacterium]|nr:16S rRNA (guanine(966)-N(2))-methyltransferase RsmD [Steroidobacteraceae bacterium]
MRRDHAGPRNNALQKNAGVLRIIGGEWRGRKIRFPGVEGLRPTPDRVRETVFNWLAPVIAGSRCLDLFAGSGAFGLEALSRGAAAVTFVERQRDAAQQLSATAAILVRGRATVHQADVAAWLAGPATPFDIVFVDPPYGSGLLADAMRALESRGWLAPQAFIYLEAPAKVGAPALPEAWILHRSGRAGAVGYHLARRMAAGG